MRDKVLAGPLDGDLDPFARPSRGLSNALSRRIDADPDSVEQAPVVQTAYPQSPLTPHVARTRCLLVYVLADKHHQVAEAERTAREPRALEGAIWVASRDSGP